MKNSFKLMDILEFYFQLEPHAIKKKKFKTTMKFVSIISLISIFSIGVSAQNSTISAKNSTRKVFIDNDVLDPLHVFLPLLGGMEIVGVSASFGDPSLVDALGEASELLKNYSMLSCIPLYEGASTPLMRTKKTFDIWQQLFGEFVWKGAWDPDYEDSYSFDNITYNSTLPGAMALINAVKQYPGEVEVYAAGLMTTVAQAISLYPKLAQEAKSLYIMGGYIDGQYAQVTGGNMVNDINTDFNLMFDPEASDIVLTSNWNDVYIGGNVTNYIFPSQDLFDKLIDEFGMENIETDPKLSGLYSFIGNGNASSVTLPLWDLAVSGFMTFPDLIESTTSVHVAIDTSFNSPFYGNLRIWPANLAPKASKVGKAKYVNTIDVDVLFDKIYDAFTKDWTQYCSAKGPVEF